MLGWSSETKLPLFSFLLCTITSTEPRVDNELKFHWALARFRGPVPIGDTPSIPMELVVYGESDGEREQSAHFHDREIIFRVKPLHFCTTCLLLCTWSIFPRSHYFLYLLVKPCVSQAFSLFTVHSPGLSQDLLRGVLCLSPLCMRWLNSILQTLPVGSLRHFKWQHTTPSSGSASSKGQRGKWVCWAEMAAISVLGGISAVLNERRHPQLWFANY